MCGCDWLDGSMRDPHGDNPSICPRGSKVQVKVSSIASALSQSPSQRLYSTIRLSQITYACQSIEQASTLPNSKSRAQLRPILTHTYANPTSAEQHGKQRSVRTVSTIYSFKASVLLHPPIASSPAFPL